MKASLLLSEETQKLLRCPSCKSNLILLDGTMQCTDDVCRCQFPIVNNVPVLINENSSIFSIDDFVQFRVTTFHDLQHGRIKRFLKKLVPSISKNLKAKENYHKVVQLLHDQSDTPRVLVIGGSVLAIGMESLVADSSIELVETDVSFGPRTTVIVDAHDIPFENESFEGVVIQGVLNCVVDPYRCVDEVHRVLKKEGVVYVEMPFMQQVCTGPFDFTRYTHLGLRRLFRRFDEILSGVQCGPGMALAWFYKYFLLSFAETKRLRQIIWAFACLTSFYLKYFDYYLIDKPGSFDAASGYFFIVQKSDQMLSNRELIKLYRRAF